MTHQHSQCRQCKDGPSDDLASVAEPVNDPPSSPGTVPPSPLPQQKLRTTCPRRLFADSSILAWRIPWSV